jgi:pyruvate dehydrogenase E1 component
MHRLADAPAGDGPHAQILASGIAVGWALQAQQVLHRDFGVLADVWSVTSWTELRREALTADDGNHHHLGAPPRIAYVTRRLRERPGPVVAVSDWMRAVPDQIAPWAPGDWSSLGTDGFGLSDTRAELRRHFGVDAPAIVRQVLERLVRRGELDDSVLSRTSPTGGEPHTAAPGNPDGVRR